MRRAILLTLGMVLFATWAWAVSPLKQWVKDEVLKADDLNANFSTLKTATEALEALDFWTASSTASIANEVVVNDEATLESAIGGVDLAKVSDFNTPTYLTTSDESATLPNSRQAGWVHTGGIDLDVTTSADAPTGNTLAAILHVIYDYDEALTSPDHGAAVRLNTRFIDGGVKQQLCVGGTEPGTACQIDADCDGGGTCTGALEKTESQAFRVVAPFHTPGEASAGRIMCRSGSDADTACWWVEAIGHGGSFTGGDEGTQGLRIFVADQETTPEGTVGTTFSAGATSISLSGLTYAERDWIGARNLIVFEDTPATVAVNEAANYNTDDTWTLGAGEATGVAGQCFAHASAAYTDSQGVATHQWLFIAADHGTLGGDQIQTEWIAQGTDWGAPNQYPTATGAGQGLIAPCEKIVSYDRRTDTATVLSATTGQTAGAGFQVPAYGAHFIQGARIVFRQSLGTNIRAHGLQVVNSVGNATRDKESLAGIWVRGAGSAPSGSAFHNERGVRITNTRRGIHQTLIDGQAANHQLARIDYGSTDFSNNVETTVVDVADDTTHKIAYAPDKGFMVQSLRAIGDTNPYLQRNTGTNEIEFDTDADGTPNGAIKTGASGIAVELATDKCIAHNGTDYFKDDGVGSGGVACDGILNGTEATF